MNGGDGNCDGVTDEDGADRASWFADEDGDGYGDINEVTLACEAPAGSVGDHTDCDDADASINPGAVESCDDLDDDCDGSID